jgi:hypothetical protein
MPKSFLLQATTSTFLRESCPGPLREKIGMNRLRMYCRFGLWLRRLVMNWSGESNRPLQDHTSKIEHYPATSSQRREFYVHTFPSISEGSFDINDLFIAPAVWMQ